MPCARLWPLARPVLPLIARWCCVSCQCDAWSAGSAAAIAIVRLGRLTDWLSGRSSRRLPRWPDLSCANGLLLAETASNGPQSVVVWSCARRSSCACNYLIHERLQLYGCCDCNPLLKRRFTMHSYLVPTLNAASYDQWLMIGCWRSVLTARGLDWSQSAIFLQACP